MKVVNRKGFTLVELLVVITIIGMLMALLFPAVQAAREAGRGNTCRNNMRNVAFAVKYYENRNNTYPAFYQWDFNTRRNAIGYRSLVYHLLPDLERADSYEFGSIDNGTGGGLFGSGNGVYLNILICPSDPQPIGDPGNYPTAYVFNAGTDVDTTAPYERANGVFGSRNNAAPAITPNWNTCNSETYVSLHDGAATTLMISENLDASSWNDWSEIRVGFGWGDHPTSQWINRKINAQNKGTTLSYTGTVQTQNTGTSDVFTKPTSNHPGSVNVAFADMHVRPLNQDIGYHVYAQLCTPWGRMARDRNGNAIDQWGALNGYMGQPLNEQDIR
ncbi:MAG: DUF1559 domain-containing protein [Planctomycetia bacterium]|nr:DUF1559 domain-containing protein [Planctomycetia bacterium]